MTTTVNLQGTIAAIQRSGLLRELKTVPIPLTSLRVWDDMASLLPSTASADDAALITGTPGTDAPTIQASDPGGTSITSKFAFEYVLPVEYIDADEVKIRAKAGVLTTLPDGATTLDFEVHLDGLDGTVGADIQSTAAIDINSLTMGLKTFDVTATTLVAGSKIIVIGTIASNDAGNLGAMLPEIQQLEIQHYVRG